MSESVITWDALIAQQATAATVEAWQASIETATAIDAAEQAASFEKGMRVRQAIGRAMWHMYLLIMSASGTTVTAKASEASFTKVYRAIQYGAGSTRVFDQKVERKFGRAFVTLQEDFDAFAFTAPENTAKGIETLRADTAKALQADANAIAKAAAKASGASDAKVKATKADAVTAPDFRTVIGHTRRVAKGKAKRVDATAVTTAKATATAAKANRETLVTTADENTAVHPAFPGLLIVNVTDAKADDIRELVARVNVLLTKVTAREQADEKARKADAAKAKADAAKADAAKAKADAGTDVIASMSDEQASALLAALLARQANATEQAEVKAD
jgi:colicin import membrane protein